MAVLHALLRHNAKARANADCSRWSPPWRRLLAKLMPLDFHLIGAESLEQALFSGYLRQMRG